MCAAASNSGTTAIGAAATTRCTEFAGVLRRGAENLSPTARAPLLAGIEAGDEHGQVAAARWLECGSPLGYST